jgi:dimethylargininase
VLRIGRRLYVGLSTRTDRAGLAALAALVSPIGYEVIEAKAGACLHLKTGATLAAHGLLVYNPAAIDASQFADVEAFAVEESAAANCVRAGNRIILPAGNPRTANKLRERGLNVVEVDVSELQKAEAGVTCMSLIDDHL